MSDKLVELKRVASTLLDDLEAGTAEVEGTLMKAKRLARLMRDADAQRWLEFEMAGYPSGFAFSSLGTCEKYVRAGRRVDSENKYYSLSLPEIDARCRTADARLRTMGSLMQSSQPMENYTVKRATEEFLAGQRQIEQSLINAYRHDRGLLSSIKSTIHSYATDVFLAIELGDVAQDIFETARRDVDNFVRAHCPKAAEQLIAINERMADHSTESRTAALTTCRRLLMTVADSLYPAKTEDWKDTSGKARKVGQEQYKNRLLAYLADLKHQDSSQAVVTAGLEHLAARLDAIYDKTCKGVHVDVSEQEARLAVIHTYLFIGELASATVAAS
ncbi:AbiTii domain-containing protein [Bradyrhizobium embrapense]